MWQFLLLVPLLSVAQGCEFHGCSNEYAELVAGQQLGHILKLGSTNVNTSIRSKEDDEIAEYCNLLQAYNQCMKTQTKSCRGNLDYHAVVTLVRKWLEQSNCTGSYHKSRQGVRTGTSVLAVLRQQQEQRRKEQLLQRKLQVCFEDAQNFTIDPELFRQSRRNSIIKHSKIIDDTGLVPGPGMLSEESESVESTPISKVKRIERAAKDQSMSTPLKSLPLDAFDGDDDEPSSEDEGIEDKEVLMCLLYGDPHLRTFRNEFQTCRCLGAWPLVDHPLFAVQVTNSRDATSSMSSISGVSKVTILVRKFDSCGIRRDLVYEADAAHLESNDNQLPITFIDGSTATANNMIRIKSSNNNLVCIQLEHIGAQVCVSHLPGTATQNYLNVIVKFHEELNSSEREIVIRSLTPTSLCKIGCPLREQIDIGSILEATGFNLLSALNDSSVSSSEVPECTGLYGYYLLSCLFDVKMKGLTSDIHKYSQTMDDLSKVQKCHVLKLLKNPNYRKSSSTQLVVPAIMMSAKIIVVIYLIGTFRL